MYILQLPLPHLKLFYHVVYENKSGNILSLKIFASNEDDILEELHIEQDYSIEYYLSIYNEMLGYIQNNLIDGSPTQ